MAKKLKFDENRLFVFNPLSTANLFHIFTYGAKVITIEVYKVFNKFFRGDNMIDLQDYIAVGQNAMYSKTVQHSDTSETYSSGLKGLLTTPKIIHMAIEAAIKAIDPYLPQDYVSVGISTSFEHTAPTSLGMTVTVRTSITAIDGHDILLDIQAWDELGDIGHGKHKRSVVTRQAVEEKALERAKALVASNR